MDKNAALKKRKMSLMGRMFCGIEAEGCSTVSHGVLYLTKQLTIQELRRIVKDAMTKDPRFRSTVCPADLTFNEQDSIDIIQHTFEHTLPSKSVRVDVEDFISDYILQPFPANLPPWQYHLVQNPDGDDFKSAIVVRMSHCLGDGITLVQLLLGMTHEMIEGGKSLTSVPVARRATKKIPLWYKITMFPFKMMCYFATIVHTTLTPLMGADKPSDVKGVVGGIKCVRTYGPYSVDEIKKVGKKWDATINDVAATCVAGAIRRYCLDPSTGSGKVVNARAIIPMNLRPDKKKGELMEVGNKIAFASLPLALNVAEPDKRLKILKNRMAYVKASPEAKWNYFLCGFFYYVLPRAGWLWICQRYTSRFTLVFTNVPGPQKPLGVCNLPLSNMMGWVPAGRCGLTISVVSYANEITVGVLADTQVVKQPYKLLQFFDEEWKELNKIARIV